MAVIDNLKKRILQEDEAEAEKIIKEAETKADEILNASRKRAEAALKEGEIKGLKEGEDRKERMIARARLDARNNILAAKQEAIDTILGLAEERLSTMDIEKYSQFMEELLLNNIETGSEEVIFSDNDKSRIDPGLVARVNERLASQNKKGLVRISSEKRNIKSGFILKNGGIEINCSINSQVRMLRESLEGEIASLLFEDR